MAGRVLVLFQRMLSVVLLGQSADMILQSRAMLKSILNFGLFVLHARALLVCDHKIKTKGQKPTSCYARPTPEALNHLRLPLLAGTREISTGRVQA